MNSESSVAKQLNNIKKILNMPWTDNGAIIKVLKDIFRTFEKVDGDKRGLMYTIEEENKKFSLDQSAIGSSFKQGKMVCDQKRRRKLLV